MEKVARISRGSCALLYRPKSHASRCCGRNARKSALTLEGVEVEVPRKHVPPPTVLDEHVDDGVVVLRVDGLLHGRAPRVGGLCGLHRLDAGVIEAWEGLRTVDEGS